MWCCVAVICSDWLWIACITIIRCPRTEYPAALCFVLKCRIRVYRILSWCISLLFQFRTLRCSLYIMCCPGGGFWVSSSARSVVLSCRLFCFVALTVSLNTFFCMISVGNRSFWAVQRVWKFVLDGYLWYHWDRAGERYSIWYSSLSLDYYNWRYLDTFNKLVRGTNISWYF